MSRSAFLDPTTSQIFAGPASCYAVNLVQATLNFGFEGSVGGEGDTALVTVSAPWIKANSTIICTALQQPTVDHDPEDVLVESIVCYAANIVPGVGFDIQATAPSNTWGQYLVLAISLIGSFS